MEIAVEPFTIAVYDSVIDLWRQCEGVGLSNADSRPGIGSFPARNPGLSLVAVASGRVVGAVLAGHDGRRGCLHHLAMHPGYRRRGIVRLLVDHCCMALAEAGISNCHLFIFHGNGGGIAFRKAAGWTVRLYIGVVSKELGPIA